jgi:hypothetical protein
MGVRVCVGACACACAARGTPCMHARTHVHTRRSPLRRGARTGPPPTHRSDKIKTIPHTHKSCARRPLRHTQLNSPRHAECVQCDFAAQSPPIRILTLLVVAIASLAHPPLRQNRNNSTHTHTNFARADHCATHSSTRHATPSVCSAISPRSRHRFDFRLCWWSPRSIEGAAASEWRHGGAPTSAALVVTTIFFHYRVGCWCEATRRHALLPQHCRWPVRCCLGQFARR